MRNLYVESGWAMIYPPVLLEFNSLIEFDLERGGRNPLVRTVAIRLYTVQIQVVMAGSQLANRNLNSDRLPFAGGGRQSFGHLAFVAHQDTKISLVSLSSRRN